MTSLFTTDQITQSIQRADETSDHWIIPHLLRLLARNDPHRAEQLRADLERRTT